MATDDPRPDGAGDRTRPASDTTRFVTERSQRGMTRRKALGVIGGTTVVLMADSSLAAAQRLVVDPDGGPALLPSGKTKAAPFPGGNGSATAPVRTVRFVRAEDQLDVLVELFNVNLTGDQFSPSGANAAVRLTFGSQHTAETAFQGAGSITPPTTAVDHTAARTSQLVTPVAGTHTLSVAGVLALIETALTVQTSGPASATATVLEIPAGLALSPAGDTVVNASDVSFTVGDTTELWLADLTNGTSPGALVPLQAVENLASGDLINAIPTSVDRDNLVTNTTGASPIPIEASRLALSSSGAFADLEGQWPGATLFGYRQHISTGRDVAVQIENAGFLAPFGIPAAITTTTERVFTADTAGDLTSAMRLERYLTLLEPSIDLGGRDHQRDGGRKNLWTNISATVDESRQVVLVPVADSSGDIPGVSDVTLLTGGGDVVVDYVAVDRNGDEVAFSLPATYITEDEAFDDTAGGSPDRLVDTYNSGARNKFRDVDLNGQRVAFADPIAAGQTSKSTETVRFELAMPETTAPSSYFGDSRVPAFNPGMRKATIFDEIVGDGTPFGVNLHPRWLSDGTNSANFDLAFLNLFTSKSGVIGGDQPTGSVAAIEVIGEIFNQQSGPAPDLPNPTATWDPATALGEGSKLLGSLLLSELMKLKPIELAVPGIDIPNTEIIADADGVTIIYSFKPELETNTTLGFIERSNTQCCVTITTTVPVTGDASVVTETVVSDFTMVFPPGGIVDIIEIDFDQVKAIVASDGSLQVIPDMAAWRLGDDLNFLQPLFDVLDSLGDLSVDVGSVYLDLDASVNLPNLGFGIVSISNFHLDFGLGLPLQGDPVQIGVGIGSPSDQIEISAGFLGGSFYTTLDLEYHESLVDWRVAAGISLFAQIGFDAVVVSASVKLRISLDFVFNKNESGDSVKVTGAVSLEGSVNVLGLVEVSVKLVASVTYKSNTETAVVKGTIHWGVDTALGAIDGKHKLGKLTYDLSDNSSAALAITNGSAPVGGTNPVRGGDKQPIGSIANTAKAGFGDLVSQADWAEYSNAFA